MSKFRNACRLGSSFIALVALGVSSASAQTAAYDGTEEIGQQPQNEIVVTANKREQSLQDVAISLTALSSQQLEDRAIVNIRDVAQQSPGMNIATNSGTTRITIRGVGLQVATGVAEANIAQHIDGIFQSQATMPSVAPVDLEQIEVLRGPQGTLYGRNSTGGTINFITSKPTYDLEAGGSIGIGSWDGRRADAYVSGPLVDDTLLARVSGYYSENDGYYHNTFLDTRLNAAKEYGTRGALRLVPSDTVTIDLSAYYQREKGSYPPQTLLRGSIPLLDVLTMPPGEGMGPLVDPDTVVVDSRPYRTAGNFDPLLRKWTWGGTLDVNVEAADWLTVRSLTGLIRHRFGPSYFDGDGTSYPMVEIGNEDDPREQRSRAFSQEVNLSGENFDDRLQWLLGYYYFSGRIDARIPAIFPDPLVQGLLGAGFGPLFPDATTVLFQSQGQALTEDTTSNAVFADMTFAILPALRLNVGGRYSADRKDTTQDVVVALNVDGNDLVLELCPNLRTRQKFNEFNGKARLEFDPADRVMTYVQWQNGFKDGGLNISACGDTFEPEKLTAYEAGIKSSWMDGQLTVNASIFRYDYDNLQVLAFRNAADSFVDNVPRSRTTGGELEVVARPVAGLALNATAAYLDSEILEMESFDQENPGAGVQDLRGRPLPNSPELTLTAGAQYSLPTSFGSITPRAELYHSSSFNFRLFDNALDAQKAYTLFNAVVTAEFGSNYTLRGYVKNIGDRKVLNQLLFSPPSGIAGEYGRPREWGVDFAVSF